MKKPLVYMWQCVVCKENFYSEDVFVRHCGKLVMWVNGIEGIGCDMNSPKVKVKVSGWIELSEENLEKLLAYPDPHMGILFALHMGYVDSSNLSFDIPE